MASAAEQYNIANSKRKFLKYFKRGFRDKTYYSWERGYKEEAHQSWQNELDEKTYKTLLSRGEYREIAMRALKIESKTNLLFSFEKMAIRDALKNAQGAKSFATGLYDYLFGKSKLESRFENYVNMLSSLPRKQTRVVTWPVATVFSFIADPYLHIFLKPRVTQAAAEFYGFDFKYNSKVQWTTYQNLLDFASQIKKDVQELQPADMIDIQSFIWVLGSDEYPND